MKKEIIRQRPFVYATMRFPALPIPPDALVLPYTSMPFSVTRKLFLGSMTIFDIPRNFYGGFPLPGQDKPCPLPDPSCWATLTVLAVNQVLSGQMHINMVQPFLSERLFQGLEVLANNNAKKNERPPYRIFSASSVCLMSVEDPHLGPIRTFEGCVNTFNGDRYASTALRFEQRLDHWMVTNLEIS